MKYSVEHIYSKKWLVVFGLIFIATASAAGGWYFVQHWQPQKPVVATVVPPPIVQKPIVTSVEGRYLFNGTIFWARGIEYYAQKFGGADKYAWPFAGLQSFDRSKYDAWTADLECPVTDRNVPYQTQVDLLTFNCRPEYLPEVSKYFNILNLANNHTDNQDRDGFIQTRDRLTTAGIQAYGDYDPSVSDDVCEVVALPIGVAKDGVKSAGKLPVAFCAWHYFYRTPREGEIAVMDRYAKIMPVFAFVHMGAEYNTSAQQIQVDIAHQVVDHGPEFVIANNPHWVQNSEVYKGKLIVYSTGNFIFDQQDSEGMRSVSIDADMTVTYDDNVAKWLALGESCTALHDDCLVRAEEQSLQKPLVKLSYAAIAGDNTTHQTKKGDATLQAAIETRLDWVQTLHELGQ